MKSFQIKQKMWSPGGKFTITDELGIPTYQVEGSIFKIQKTFIISDMQGKKIRRIQRKTMTFLQKFWDMNFRLLQNDQEVASISQEWLRLTSTYNIEVYDDQYADLVISLVIAIDYVKAIEKSSARSSASH